MKRKQKNRKIDKTEIPFLFQVGYDVSHIDLVYRIHRVLSKKFSTLGHILCVKITSV